MKKFFGVLVLVSLMGCMVACGDKTIKPDNVNNENVGTVQSGEVQKENKRTVSAGAGSTDRLPR